MRSRLRPKWDLSPVVESAGSGTDGCSPTEAAGGRRGSRPPEPSSANKENKTPESRPTTPPAPFGDPRFHLDDSPTDEGSKPASPIVLSGNLKDYEDLGEIGRGQFGAVHKVRLKSNKDRMLVWKKFAYSSMPEREKRQLQQEVQLLQALDHPNVVKYVGKINDKARSHIYLVMEHCDGGDLAQYLRHTVAKGVSLSEDHILLWFGQLLDALHYCHKRKEGRVLHRDIKPQNILITNHYSRVKLGDFGLAKLLKPSQRMAKTHVGTPYYMSPEVLARDEYDERSDIWSLGCLLFEMASGRSPFSHANSFDHLRTLVDKGTLPEMPSRYSLEFRNLVAWMLTRDPNQRPDADALKRSLLVRFTQTLKYKRLFDQQSTRLKEKEDEINFLKKKVASLESGEIDEALEGAATHSKTQRPSSNTLESSDVSTENILATSRSRKEKSNGSPCGYERLSSHAKHSAGGHRQSQPEDASPKFPAGDVDDERFYRSPISSRGVGHTPVQALPVSESRSGSSSGVGPSERPTSGWRKATDIHDNSYSPDISRLAADLAEVQGGRRRVHHTISDASNRYIPAGIDDGGRPPTGRDTQSTLPLTPPSGQRQYSWRRRNSDGGGWSLRGNEIDEHQRGGRRTSETTSTRSPFSSFPTTPTTSEKASTSTTRKTQMSQHCSPQFGFPDVELIGEKENSRRRRSVTRTNYEDRHPAAVGNMGKYTRGGSGPSESTKHATAMSLHDRQPLVATRKTGKEKMTSATPHRQTIATSEPFMLSKRKVYSSSPAGFSTFSGANNRPKTSAYEQASRFVSLSSRDGIVMTDTANKPFPSGDSTTVVTPLARQWKNVQARIKDDENREPNSFAANVTATPYPGLGSITGSSLQSDYLGPQIVSYERHQGPSSALRETQRPNNGPTSNGYLRIREGSLLRHESSSERTIQEFIQGKNNRYQKF